MYMKLLIMKKDSFWCYRCNCTKKVFLNLIKLDKNYLRHITSTRTIFIYSKKVALPRSAPMVTGLALVPGLDPSDWWELPLLTEARLLLALPGREL